MQKRTAPVPVIFCSVIGYMEIYIKVDRRSQIIAQISETGKISKDRVERPEGRRLAPENGDIFGSIFGGCLASPIIEGNFSLQSIHPYNKYHYNKSTLIINQIVGTVFPH